MIKRTFSLFVCVMLIITMSISAFAMTLKLTDYDNGHINFDPAVPKIEYTISSASGNDGIIYVYLGDIASLSDSNPPIFMDYLQSPADLVSGTIRFLEGFSTGEYTVLYVNAIGSDSASFKYYTDEELLEEKRKIIFNELKALESPNETNIEEVFNKRADTFSIISSDAGEDIKYYYDVEVPANIYARMKGSVSELESYDAMIALFVAKAKEEAKSQGETPVVSTEKDNTTTGDTSTVIKDTPSGGSGSSYGGSSVGNVVTPVVPNSAFSDMQSHWAEKFTTELKDRGIMNGYEDGSFRGENPITRAELAKTLAAAMDITATGGTAYPDVSQDAWYAPYIDAVSAAGVVTGFEDGSFRPDINIIRQDAALMIYRAMSLKKELPMGYTIFADELSISEYASSAIRTLGDLGIITGDTNRAFNPADPITRAELAALICRALDYIESH